MLLQRKFIPTRRCCLQMKAATEGKVGFAQLNGRRNGSEMRLFPRKAVILIPSCAVLKSVFLVTFVTTDKSNPAEQKNKNRLHRLPTKEERKS